jgi:hypothetical protein
MPVSDDFSFHALLPALFSDASEMKVSRPANVGQRRKDCGEKKNNHTVENMFAAACRAILFASPSVCLKMNDKKPANFACSPIPYITPAKPRIFCPLHILHNDCNTSCIALNSATV